MDSSTTAAPMTSDCETESSSDFSWWPSWRPTSMSLLKTAESKILARIRNDLWARFVKLPNQDRIWTLTLTNKTVHKPAEEPPKTPLVMVHGFGGGVGLWVRNLDGLSRSRPVHAFDLLGFGRSSRPHFPSDAAKAEEQFVDSIERWRQSVGLESMILLGHSLGGYLATSYAIQYPSRVSHLILVDPWGFPERPKAENQESQGTEAVKTFRPPRWVKVIAGIVSFFNPLAVIRAAGPWGPGLVNRFRPDFRRKFEDLFDDDTMTQYIYHCNAQTPRRGHVTLFQDEEARFQNAFMKLQRQQKQNCYRKTLFKKCLVLSKSHKSWEWGHLDPSRQCAELFSPCDF
uniref:Abhydrolase domain containing 4 n=1 Tax=Oryzias latipes TaxID=8090 RepID=A0A3P9H0R2_ORYLA